MDEAGDDAPSGAGTPASGTDRRSGALPPTRLAAETWEDLFRAQVTLMRRFEADGDFAPLTSREYDVLFQLSRGDGGAMRMRRLNDLLLISQPSLSRMVDRLVGRGLLERRAAPEDARGVVVALTDAGARLQRTIGRRHVRSIGRYVGGALTDEELTLLGALTRTLREAQADL